MNEVVLTSGESAARPQAVAATRKPISWGRVMGALAPFAVVAVLLLVNIPVCPSKNLLGIPCPGCGMTRAVKALLMGDVVGAFHMHPLVFVFAPLGAYWFGREVLEALGVLPPKGVLLPFRVPQWVYGALVIALFGVWGLRLGGFLGGHPDGFHPEHGILWRGLSVLFSR